EEIDLGSELRPIEARGEARARGEGDADAVLAALVVGEAAGDDLRAGPFAGGDEVDALHHRSISHSAGTGKICSKKAWSSASTRASLAGLISVSLTQRTFDSRSWTSLARSLARCRLPSFTYAPEMSEGTAFASSTAK